MRDITESLNAKPRERNLSNDELFLLVYDHLRQLAAVRLKNEQSDQTLQPTALVHEAYLRLNQGEHKSKWDNQGHFFAAAAEAMRRILVERARAKQTSKRGGGWDRMEWEDAEFILSISPSQLLDIDEGLEWLAESAPVSAKVVKLRCFAGLTLEEVAVSLQISRKTVTKHWAYGRAVLADWLESDRTQPPNNND